MGLFGPNIKKMKNNMDIAGLASLMKDNNLQTRVEATEALLEIGESKASEAIAKRYSEVFKLGDMADKVELMIMMQGRYSQLDTMCGWVSPMKLPQARAVKILDFEKLKFTRKSNLDLAKSVLSDIAINTADHPFLRLFALTTLVELGDRDKNVLGLMIALLVNIEGLNPWTVGETLRALSSFPDESDIVNFLIKVQKGDGWASVEVQEAAIYALGAMNTSAAREYLEYLATSDNKLFKKKAQIALKLFGKAKYDEIKSKCS